MSSTVDRLYCKSIVYLYSTSLVTLTPLWQVYRLILQTSYLEILS